MSLSDNSYRNIADRLMFSISNKKCGGDLSLPHIEKGDIILSVVYITDNVIGAEPKECRPVSYEMMQNFGFSEDELFEVCMRNANENFKGNFQEYQYDLLTDIDADGVMTPKVYVVSNDCGFNGAAAIFYTPDIMSDFCDAVDTDFAVIFPLSDAGVFCFGVDDVDDLGLQLLYEDFISSQKKIGIKPDDILSDSICIYDKKSGVAKSFDNEEEFTFDIVSREFGRHNDFRR